MECLEAALTAQGREIVVVGPSELDDDQVRDMAEIQTSFFPSFCLWTYGREVARNGARRVIEGAPQAEGSGGNMPKANRWFANPAKSVKGVWLSPDGAQHNAQTASIWADRRSGGPRS